MIVLKNVVKSYDNIVILKNINLKIRQESFCSISGKSGAGKSTLLKIIAGMESPTSGQITLDGKDLKGVGYPKLWGKHFSFVFQNYFLLDDKTVKKISN